MLEWQGNEGPSARGPEYNRKESRARLIRSPFATLIVAQYHPSAAHDTRVIFAPDRADDRRGLIATTLSIAPVSHVRLLFGATLAAACLAGSATASAQDQSEIAGRRAALAKAIGEGTLVVIAAPEAAISRNGYVPDQNYLYLTGLREPGGALLMRIHGGIAESQIFVADKDPAAEVWTGVRMGVEGARPRPA